jgi:hypothetical protein
VKASVPRVFSCSDSLLDSAATPLDTTLDQLLATNSATPLDAVCVESMREVF